MSSLSAAFQSPTTSSQAIAAQRFAQPTQTSPAAQRNSGGYAVQDGFTKNDSNSKISKMLGQTAMTPGDLQSAFQGAAVGNGLDLPAPGSNANFDLSGKHKLPTSPNEPSQSDSKDPSSLFQGADSKLMTNDDECSVEAFAFTTAAGAITTAAFSAAAGSMLGGAGALPAAASGVVGGAVAGFVSQALDCIKQANRKEDKAEDEKKDTKESTSTPKPDTGNATPTEQELEEIERQAKVKMNGLTNPGRGEGITELPSERPLIDFNQLQADKLAPYINPGSESEDDDGLNVIGAEPGEMPVTGLTQPGQIVGPSGGIEPKGDNDIDGVHPSVAGHSSKDCVRIIIKTIRSQA